jgi:hypothetical protein
MAEKRETKATAPARKAAAKKRPAAKEKPEPKKPPRKRAPRLPSLKQAQGWVGMRIDGLESRTIGRVAGIHVDVQDGDPRWVVIRLGPFAGCTAIPFEHVAEGAGRLWAGYERDWVREAPRFRTDEALAAAEEIELCAHWGIGEDRGRAAQVAPHDENDITAIPAEVEPAVRGWRRGRPEG